MDTAGNPPGTRSRALVYLDNNATTPLDPRVFEAMAPYYMTTYGNASSITHKFGLEARSAVEWSRQLVAEIIGAQPGEIIFTSGATESNNLALLGVVGAHSAANTTIVISAVEHSSVIEPARFHAGRGGAVSVIPVGGDGSIDVDLIAGAIDSTTALVSIMHANNEVGTILPIVEIGRVCRDRGVPFHSDAAQSIGKIPFRVDDLMVDLASISAHKLYGPKGVGALYVRSRRPRVQIAPQMHGGGQQDGRRPGTLNVPGIVGLATAMSVAASDLGSEREAIRRRRDRLMARITAGYPAVALNGPDLDDAGKTRLDGNLNLWFPGIDGVRLLREAGVVAGSTGSACAESSDRPSHVLRALDFDDRRIRESIRLGVGRFNTDDEIDRAGSALAAAANRLFTSGGAYTT